MTTEKLCCEKADSKRIKIILAACKTFRIKSIKCSSISSIKSHGHTLSLRMVVLTMHIPAFCLFR